MSQIYNCFENLQSGILNEATSKAKMHPAICSHNPNKYLGIQFLTLKALWQKVKVNM